jgi:hypothetical protein
MTDPREIFPLTRTGPGWSEPQDPDPLRRYDGYRIVCKDPECPALSGPVVPLSGHSHIYIDEGLWSVLHPEES